MPNIESHVAGNSVRVIFHDNGEIVGSAFGGLEDGVVSLDTIQVNPGKRGHGIGGKIISAFVGAACHAGAKKIQGEIKPEHGLHLERTRQFYSDLGFEVGPDDSLNMDL